MTAVNNTRVEAVLDAAVALLDAEGESALGWNRVAQALGVKPPSLYNHFTNIAELRKAVALRAWALFVAEADRGIARSRGPEGALRAIANSYRSLARERPGLFSVMSSTSIPLTDAGFSVIGARALALFDPPLEALGVPSARRVHAVRALRAAIHGFVHLEAAGQFAMDESVDRSFTVLIDVLVQGLRGPDRR